MHVFFFLPPGKEAEFTIEEDDRYYLDIINTNSRSIIMTLNLNVSSKMYDISKAKKNCSTRNGLCQLRFLFPNTHYVILTTPNSVSPKAKQLSHEMFYRLIKHNQKAYLQGDLDGWYIELSFVARVVTYIAILGTILETKPHFLASSILFHHACNCISGIICVFFTGFITIILLLIMKYLGACEADNTSIATAEEEINETQPILPEKSIRYSYGTVEDDEESVASTSSEELYDAKLCVICYDDQRNCFFVPCGHCATCYDCAQRYNIMKELNIIFDLTKIIRDS